MRHVTKPCDNSTYQPSSLSSIAELVRFRDAARVQIHERLKPLLDIVLTLRPVNSVRVTEVYEDQGKILVYLKLVPESGRPQNAAIELAAGAIDRFDPRSMRALVFDHLAIIPDDHE